MFSQTKIFQISSENKENSVVEVTAPNMSLPTAEVSVETGLP